ncbi:glycosyl transferase family protein [Sphingobium yanoikuyae]|jgi:adsorption protein B|uniref:glycosyl transferase family protein n=1 Tax=Sphingobium yanoikuyae TaxID=13690 RepID=UPI00241C6F54|nr:glycosyl transferase family protein [Sphingobium yanoikuyae]
MLFGALQALHYEILLFAVIGFALGGLDDLAIDILFLIRRAWRAVRHPRRLRMTMATLPPSSTPGRIAIFIPAWQEADVIGAMLRHAVHCWGDADYRIFVGAYPNDPATIDAIASIAIDQPHIILCLNDRPGPTTKADCLNINWRSMLAEEGRSGIRFKAIVMHDAEDVVHPDEIRLFDHMIDRFALVQLPVLPLPGRGTWFSRAIANHYCDEFAEAHGKSLTVREFLGASIPSAGVACAFERNILAALAPHPGAGPFDPGSLTEDYEAGLRIADMGGRGIFLRIRDAQGRLVATREYFPDSAPAAIRQKARWIIGISLAGWDRMGWQGGPAEWWMRIRDRRATLAALIIVAAYATLLLWSILELARPFLTPQMRPSTPLIDSLLTLNLWLMAWRIMMRAIFAGHAYGWRHGLAAVPRMFVGNAIAILAARRAVILYVQSLLGKPLVWDKTQHRFPDMEEQA